MQADPGSVMPHLGGRRIGTHERSFQDQPRRRAGQRLSHLGDARLPRARHRRRVVEVATGVLVAEVDEGGRIYPTEVIGGVEGNRMLGPDHVYAYRAVGPAGAEVVEIA